MLRKIEIANRFSGLRIHQPLLRRALRTLDIEPDFTLPPGDLSLVFVDREEMIELHQRYLDDPSPTDVITFPGDPAMEQAGEVIVSVAEALLRSTDHGLTPNEEIFLYLIHGWLHLTGKGDHNPAERRAMRRAEKTALDLIRPLPEAFALPVER